jgi:hypothetical protein
VNKKKKKIKWDSLYVDTWIHRYIRRCVQSRVGPRSQCSCDGENTWKRVRCSAGSKGQSADIAVAIAHTHIHTQARTPARTHSDDEHWLPMLLPRGQARQAGSPVISHCMHLRVRLHLHSQEAPPSRPRKEERIEGGRGERGKRK